MPDSRVTAENAADMPLPLGSLHYSKVFRQGVSFWVFQEADTKTPQASVEDGGSRSLCRVGFRPGCRADVCERQEGRKKD